MSHQNHSRFLITFLLLLILFLTACDNSTPTPQPTTYTTDCNTSSLIENINQANSDPGPGIINLDPNCSYILTAADNSIVTNNQTHQNGLPVITSEITINGNNAVITIQGSFFGHFFVNPAGDLGLYDLTLENGTRMMGGAVIVLEGDFFAANTKFLNNKVYPTDNNVGRGGAIYNQSGKVNIINNSLFQGNHAGETTAGGNNLGGAIFSKNGHLLVSTSTFDSNFAAGSGGAIYTRKNSQDESGGLIIINESEFFDNTALHNGGAVVVINEVNGVFISHSSFSQNQADSSGGAIFANGSELHGVSIYYYRNSADYGGAIYTKRPGEGIPSVLDCETAVFLENTASEIGGAIFSENSDFSLHDSVINYSSAGSCGAIRNGGHPDLDVVAGDLETVPHISSSSEISEGFFFDNQATHTYGGAICHMMGDLSIQETRIVENRAITYGGGLLLLDESELSGVSIEGNEAERGGGATVGYPEPDTYIHTFSIPSYLTFHTSISNSRFVGNQASSGGGSLWAHHGGIVSITKSTFNHNKTDSSGGGIYQFAGNLYITNSTFSTNMALKGGGLYNQGGLISHPILGIRHCTFAYNIANESSGGGNNTRWGGGGLNAGGDIRIQNSLFTQNINNDCQLVNGPSYSISGTVDSDGRCRPFLTEPNPMIGQLSYNGGGMKTHALLPGSPLIDILSDCDGLTDDQRGVSRPQGGSCDPGSYEFDPANPPPTPPAPPAPPPPAPGPAPPPTSEPESSSSQRCDLFDDLEYSLVLMNIPRETTNLTLYFKMLGGVPGLELEIPDDPNPWIYRALLGQTESVECSFQGYESRLYCTFVLPETALGSARDLLLYLNECDDPILSQPRVSIPEPRPPQCSADLGEEACLAAGGTWKRPLTGGDYYCDCP